MDIGNNELNVRTAWLFRHVHRPSTCRYYGDQGQRNAKSLMKLLGKHAVQKAPEGDPKLL